MTETPQQAAERLAANIGKLVKAYEYTDASGKPVFWNLRISTAQGKTFRMMTDDAAGGYQLRRGDAPDNGWPLYGLHSLDRNGRVWIVEGEKDCDSLHRLGVAAVTSGATSTCNHADWTPLRNRRVILWPDNDAAGSKYMDEVAHALQPLGCEIERIDPAMLNLPPKADATDWIEAENLIKPQIGIEALLALPRKPVVIEDDRPRVKIVRADTITPQRVDWIWDGWLAAGKLHLLGGQPGTGKTTIAMALAATITTGGRWPDGTQAERGSVLVWSAEDDPADTLIPRLRAAGADTERVHIIKGTQKAGESYSFDPARDVELLLPALAKITDLRLIVLDPLVSAVAGDSHKNAEVRRGLQPLVDMAQSSRCALLGITHFSKGTGGREPIERITGSLAFGALARIVLVTAKRDEVEDDGASRFLARAKSNIGQDGGGFVYDIAQVEIPGFADVIASSVTWGKSLDGTARELLADAERQDEGATLLAFCGLC